ncbi:MAG: 50S ribosomal protein L9 [Flavobacteriales bacterium]|jgi:large subunit ribosomal protein L9|uniref:50S ribosomal protein L9 n=1 Tax=Blattabacterium sp. (Mastotermes darwiniensis) TaxID=39768 RepID=UPI000231DF72|nr:50S ribosomal protein L9 [Blattabacterium sp. (Mastotermes darwiniensis)]AER40394.1 50S ribosomal protein L9 [Blattabacterium sp. (Mastotermes darwiniensis) str. MADAR]MDR1804885.1 50S ribosomal protein L9 [Flavobacteriales bacterium]
MKVILKKDVENLGFQYEELDVKPGYARNYLIPKGYAVLALPGTVKNIREILKHRHRKESFLMDKSKEIEKKLKQLTIKIKAKVGKGGKLFGSINNQEVMKALNEKGIHIEKKFIRIPGNKVIKTIGKHQASIRLHRQRELLLNFEVLPT